MKLAQSRRQRLGHVIEICPIESNIATETEQVKLYAVLTCLFRAVSVTCLHPANVAGAKASFITDTHLTAGNKVDSVVGMPVQTRMEVRRKIRLNQKRLAGSEDPSRRGRSPVGVVKALPVELAGPNMRCHLVASSASLVITDC